MPLSSIKEIVHQINNDTNTYGKVSAASEIGRKMIAKVQSMFDVSEDAARVRLLKLDFIEEGNTIAQSMNLF